MTKRAIWGVAFKVTWVEGKRGPWTSPCTPQAREDNILAGRVWCGDPDCECYQLFRKEDTRTIPGPDAPCYDCAIFDEWSFCAGVYHHGPRRGEAIPMGSEAADRLVGKPAFFTSRKPREPEANRRVIGCYTVDAADWRTAAEGGLDAHEAWSTNAKTRWRVATRQIELDSPRFWDFHRQAGGPRWGSGLFRYIYDQEEAKAMADAVKALDRRRGGRA